MQKDKVLEYLGFHNYESKCHLRFLYNENQKFVIICSEMLTNYGTSVTNYIEEIQKETLEFIQEEFKKPTLKEVLFNYFKNTDIDNIFDDILNRLDKRKYKYLPFILELMKDTITISKTSKSSREDLEFIFNNLIWIEHYPIGRGIKDKEDTYAHVIFKDNYPEWDYVSLESICKYTGYSKEQFQIPIDKLSI